MIEEKGVKRRVWKRQKELLIEEKGAKGREWKGRSGAGGVVGDAIGI